MQKCTTATFVFVSQLFLYLSNANASYNRAAANAPVLQQQAQQQQQLEQSPATWQPMPQSNWIILQSASADGDVDRSVAATADSRNSAAVSKPKEQSRTYPHVKGERQRFSSRNNHNMQATSQQQRLPVNYYAYEQTAGNYTRSRMSDMALMKQPFVFAIRKMPISTAKLSKDDTSLQRPVAHHTPTIAPRVIVPRWETAVNNHAESQPLTDGLPTAADNMQEIAASETASNTINNDSNEDTDDKLDEIIVPLQSALERIKSFCVLVQDIISSEAKSTVEGESNSATTSASIMSTSTARAVTSLDGKQSRSKLATVGTGRGKKLKKKLKKLLLPLLIAYKLKFLTLIPVLIGGLTLLVGTTGLAGFFFALFTAVMSLRSTGGSKSIVVKKI